MKSNALSHSRSRTRLIVNSGLMIAISIVLKLLFEMYIPLGGFPALRINLTSLPIMLSGILLGPLSGFIVGFISDLLCFVIKPNGPFFIGFTLASGLIGMLPGLLWIFLEKRDIHHLEWFNLVLVVLSLIVLWTAGLFTFQDGTVYYDGAAIHPLLMVLFILLMAIFIIFPVLAVRRSSLQGTYRSDYVLFIVSVTQLVVSIVLNTLFLKILYGSAIAVLLPGRIITNIFLIPLYTIALTLLLKILPKFVKN